MQRDCGTETCKPKLLFLVVPPLHMLQLYVHRSIVFKTFKIIFSWYFSPFFAGSACKGKENNIYFFLLIFCFIKYKSLPCSEKIQVYKISLLYAYAFCVFVSTSLASLPPGVMLSCIIVCKELEDSTTDIEKTYQKSALSEGNLVEV